MADLFSRELLRNNSGQALKFNSQDNGSLVDEERKKQLEKLQTGNADKKTEKSSGAIELDRKQIDQMIERAKEEGVDPDTIEKFEKDFKEYQRLLSMKYDEKIIALGSNVTKEQIIKLREEQLAEFEKLKKEMSPLSSFETNASTMSSAVDSMYGEVVLLRRVNWYNNEIGVLNEKLNEQGSDTDQVYASEVDRLMDTYNSLPEQYKETYKLPENWDELDNQTKYSLLTTYYVLCSVDKNVDPAKFSAIYGESDIKSGFKAKDISDIEKELKNVKKRERNEESGSNGGNSIYQ